MQDKILIIGGGPAGMGCAHVLAENGRPFRLLEENNEVGGLCRTLNFHGYLFDIGGHRFITRSEEINKLWADVAGEDLMKVKRLSRIYYRKRFFRYPLSFADTIRNLGLLESGLCFLSCVRHKAFPSEGDDTFEGWVINHFGRRLYSIFFKPYTEKVWALACRDLSAEWARQRMRGLSLKVAVESSLFGNGKRNIKTLSGEFLYPKTGPGLFYNRLLRLCAEKGGNFCCGTRALKVKHNNKKILAVETVSLKTGDKKSCETDYLFSSMPLPILMRSLDPLPPAEVTRAADKLKFRSLLTVNIILDKETVFPDQWLYIHSPEVRLGRIQNFKNWSPFMVPDRKKTSLGLEYFCSEEDSLWQMDDVELINFALKELEKVGLTLRHCLIDGFVVRCKNAYPIYSLAYRNNVVVLREYLKRFSNLQTMGRSGLFRYDNSDHALLSGIYAAENYVDGRKYNLWDLSTDNEYLDS